MSINILRPRLMETSTLEVLPSEVIHIHLTAHTIAVLTIRVLMEVQDITTALTVVSATIPGKIMEKPSHSVAKAAEQTVVPSPRTHKVLEILAATQPGSKRISRRPWTACSRTSTWQ